VCGAGGASVGESARGRVPDAVKKAAAALGHTPAVCKSKYVNPAILHQYMLRAAPAAPKTGKKDAAA
jgi:DNA topoisomerase IB